MSGIKPFSAFPEYLAHNQNRIGVMVDTSVLFAETYPLDLYNEECEVVFSTLAAARMPIYANISVRAEFLENHRRVILAESLIDVLEEWGAHLQGPLLEKLKAHRTSYRRKVQEEKSTKLDVGQIAMFRRLLSGFKKNGKDAWLVFCEDYLEGKLSRVWDEAEEELGINFLSLRSSDRDDLLDSLPEWKGAVSLMGRYGLGSSDSLILNLFLCSKFSVLLTADLELADRACRESQGRKDIFVPDSAINQDRNIQAPI